MVGNLSQNLQLLNSLKFNGGGHLNHSLFWKNLQPATKGGGVLLKGFFIYYLLLIINYYLLLITY